MFLAGPYLWSQASYEVADLHLTEMPGLFPQCIGIALCPKVVSV